ncbi:C40 family peptidase [Nakamurella lactea]|uniref:C40 family peptidase n=1 Tax=Nakamurella lactea TaxID=459515 RepID=UPI00068492EC|nr:C40 family peptidase [Nakamurella lactea]
MFTAPGAAATPSAAPATPKPYVAEPTTPDNSADAKKAWLQASEDADALNEKVLVAAEAEKAAKAASSAAAKSLTARQAEADAAQAEVTSAEKAAADAKSAQQQAARQVADFQSKVDQFADASFRGAHFGSMSALFTSSSAEDFLDQASMLDVVAQDSSQNITNLAAANARAKQATTKATATATAATAAANKAAAAVTAAKKAKASKDAAEASAHRAAQDVTKQQANLNAKAAAMKKLYNQLTEQEREAALREQQQAAEAQAAQTQADTARADRNRATTPGTTDQGSAGAASDSAPAAPAPAPAASGAAATAVAAALSKVGAPYVFGAAGPSAFDCSGLTSWAWAQAGVSIPRTSSGQAGLTYVPLDQLRPGDLITYYSPVHHVAMYIGNGQIVNASTSSKPVMVMSMYYNNHNPTGHRVG